MSFHNTFSYHYHATFPHQNTMHPPPPTPPTPPTPHLLQLKLGAYMWTERDKPSTSLPHKSSREYVGTGSREYVGIGEAFRDTFCVETAVKCLYVCGC